MIENNKNIIKTNFFLTRSLFLGLGISLVLGIGQRNSVLMVVLGYLFI